MKLFVDIVKDTGEVVRHMKATSRHDAERIERGANINLNHEHYFTRIVEEPEAVGAEDRRCRVNPC